MKVSSTKKKVSDTLRYGLGRPARVKKNIRLFIYEYVIEVTVGCKPNKRINY